MTDHNRKIKGEGSDGSEDEEEVKKEDGKEGDAPKIEEVGEDTENEAKIKKTKKVKKYPNVNGSSKHKPLCMMKSEDVKYEEYASFYMSFSNDWEDHPALEGLRKACLEKAWDYEAAMKARKRSAKHWH